MWWGRVWNRAVEIVFLKTSFLHSSETPNSPQSILMYVQKHSFYSNLPGIDIKGHLRLHPLYTSKSPPFLPLAFPTYSTSLDVHPNFLFYIFEKKKKKRKEKRVCYMMVN